jgi:PKD repeat protein
LPGRRQTSRSAEGVDLGRGFWLPLCLALSLGCHQRAYVAPGLPDGGISDAEGDLFAPLTLDIAVTGCPSFDVVNVVCSGSAPLTVSFAPVGSPALTTFLWTFGDGTPSSSERAPSHTYALPGKYDVGVTGQGSTVGSLSQIRHQLISVEPLTTGAACDVDSQCGDGLRCLCKSGSGCGPAFSRGLCSTACATGFCGAGAVCAAFTLAPPGGPSTGADAAIVPDAGPASPICLADCGGGVPCAPGLVCQQIPGGGASAWVHGCLPLGAARDFGASCRNANGMLDGAACTTGYCADIGTRGLCSAACDGTHLCPGSAACARLSVSSVCLPACSPATPCTSDPSLGCTVAADANAGIDGGLTITAGDLAAAYCAPR